MSPAWWSTVPSRNDQAQFALKKCSAGKVLFQLVWCNICNMWISTSTKPTSPLADLRPETQILIPSTFNFHIHLNRHNDCFKSDLSLGVLQVAFFQVMRKEFIRFFIHFRLVDQPHRGPQFGTLALHKEAFPFTYSCMDFLASLQVPWKVLSVKSKTQKGQISWATGFQFPTVVVGKWKRSGQHVYYNTVSLYFHLVFSSPSFKLVIVMLTWDLILQNILRWKVYWFSKGLWISMAQFTGRSLSEHPSLFIL